MGRGKGVLRGTKKNTSEYNQRGKLIEKKTNTHTQGGNRDRERVKLLKSGIKKTKKKNNRRRRRRKGRSCREEDRAVIGWEV